MSETSNFSDFSADDDQSEYVPPKKKGKKKLRNENAWKKNVRKIKRNSGEEYTSVRGKKVPKKVFQHITKCCSKNCCNNLDNSAQKKIFSEFWGIGDKTQQDTLLLSCLENVPKLRENVGPNKKKRDNQWKYFFTVQGFKIRTCRKLLLSLLKISEKRLRIVQKNKLSGEPVRDMRGKHENRPHKISHDVYNMIKEHWALLPSKKSHYGRASERRYFENPDLSVLKLYRAFQQHYFEQKNTVLKMKYNTYHRYFREHSIYSFRLPRTDVCDFCTKCKVLLEANPEDPCKIQYRLHQKKIESYNALKKMLLESVQNNPDTETLVLEFDYAQNLPIPKLNITSQFYKRLLWLFNFNIHCHNDGSSSFYCFLETDSKKGPNTVCSFIHHFVIEKLQHLSNIKKIVFLSDSCGGQNKNITVVMFCTWLAKSLNITVEHIFPVRGHSYNQCDRNFGRYSILLKSLETIETAEQYLRVLSSARSNPSPFKVLMASYLIEDWNKGLQSYVSKIPTGKQQTRFSIQKYVKLEFTPEGDITTSRFYSASDQKYTFKKNNLPVSKDDLNLQQVEKPGVKEVKIKDILSLTPYMKPENAEWLKQVLTFQEEQDLKNPEPGPSRRLLRPHKNDSDDSFGSSEFN